MWPPQSHGTDRSSHGAGSGRKGHSKPQQPWQPCPVWLCQQHLLPFRHLTAPLNKHLTSLGVHLNYCGDGHWSTWLWFLPLPQALLRNSLSPHLSKPQLAVLPTTYPFEGVQQSSYGHWGFAGGWAQFAELLHGAMGSAGPHGPASEREKATRDLLGGPKSLWIKPIMLQEVLSCNQHSHGWGAHWIYVKRPFL